MDAKELSAYANLSLQTIYNLVHTNQIPFKRISKKRASFDKKEIDEWLKTRKRKIRHPKPLADEEHPSGTQIESVPAAGEYFPSSDQSQRTSMEASPVDAISGLRTIEKDVTLPETFKASRPEPNPSKGSTPDDFVPASIGSAPSFPKDPLVIPSLPTPHVSPFPGGNPLAALPTTRSFFGQWLSVILFMAIGWGGGFLYFHYKGTLNASQKALNSKAELQRESDLRETSSGVIDLASFIEQGKPGRIDVLIPSTESEKTEVHMNRISDIKLQGEAASLIKPLLIQTLKSDSGDYAFKSRTIDIVRPYADDPKIQEAIIHLAKHEKDPAIRLKAVTVLDKVAGNDAVKDVLLDLLLNDENMGIRFKALEIIEKNMDLKAISVLKKVKERETDENIRNKAKALFDNFERKTI